MELLERLRRRTLPVRLAGAVLLALPGLLLLAGLWPVLRDLLKGPRDLYSLSAQELEGTYAAAQIDTIYDWYADTVSTAADGTEELVARQYLVPLKDGRTFIGVEVPAERIAAGDHVLEQTQLWLQDPDAYFWDGVYLEVRGEIQPMDESTRALYYDLLRTYYGLDEEALADFPPMVLVHGRLHGLNGGSITVLGLASLAFLAAAVVTVMRAFGGKSQRQIRTYCARRPDLQQALAELDELCRVQPSANRLRCDRLWLLYEDGEHSWVLRCEDVAWVYITRRGLMVCSRSESPAGRRHEVRVRTRAREVIDWLLPRLPGTVFGYHPQWERAYNLDPVHFGRETDFGPSWNPAFR